MANEFVRMIPLAAVRSGLQAQNFEASEGERAALAARFGISELTSFSGRFQADIDPHIAGGVVVEGEYDANLVQPCRYTLVLVAEQIREQFRVRFLPGLPEDELVWDEIDEGDLERLPGDSIDAGEVIAQYLGMSINPYPQKEGTSARDMMPGDDTLLSEEEARKAASPFASLKKIKDKL